jgi:hypothetical protein
MSTLVPRPYGCVSGSTSITHSTPTTKPVGRNDVVYPSLICDTLAGRRARDARDARTHVELLAVGTTPEELDGAFWQACHGGRLRLAELLLTRGASIDAKPDDSDQTPNEIAASIDTRREQLVNWLREHGAASADEPASE